MVPPSMVVSRETDFGVEGSSTSRPSRPRAALPDLQAGDFAESGLQSGLGHLAQLADGGDAALGQRSGVHVADAVEFFHGQRGQESFFFAGGDHAKAARALETRSDGGDHFGARRADGNAQAGAAVDLRLQTPQRGFVIGIEALGAGEVEVKSSSAAVSTAGV